MKLELPTASRKRLEELLEYLGKTENYSEYYKGNRAEDFKKCFDIESPWCWKYADIVLRGLGKRTVGPGDEVHHAVPRSFYGVKNRCHKIDDGNLFTLSYAEHVWAHYCLVCCATGKMRDKMVRAFLTMYRIGICNKHALMPSEAELLDAIPEMEIKRIQAMEPRWAKVEAEGRTHSSEDLLQAKRDYYKANKDEAKKKVHDYYQKHREHYLKQKKSYRKNNKDTIKKKRLERYQKNKNIYHERNKAYRDAHREEINTKGREYYHANREKKREAAKLYRINHLDECRIKCREYRQNNLERCKARNREYYHAHAEELNRKQKEHRQIPEVKAKRAAQQKAYREANKEKIYSQQKAYREANKEKVRTAKKTYYDANRERIIEQKRVYNAEHKEIRSVKAKAYRAANHAQLVAQQKSKYDSMVNAGYRYRKDPVTGKRGWVFVGKPATPETPKSTSGAA